MAKTRLMAIHTWQPWADLICCGAKTIETRTWNLNHRGLVLICATKTLRKEGREAIERYQSSMWEGGPLLPADYKPRLGVAVAVANLVASRPMTNKDKRAAAYADHWSIEYQDKAGDWHKKIAWVLQDVTPIEPFELAGRQRPFFVDVKSSKLAPSLLLDLPPKVEATTDPRSRQISLF